MKNRECTCNGYPKHERNAKHCSSVSNLENNGDSAAFYHRGHNAESVAEYNYKLRDDSVHPREFLGTDSEDGIESILRDRQGHSLHEYIDGDAPLRPFICRKKH